MATDDESAREIGRLAHATARQARRSAALGKREKKGLREKKSLPVEGWADGARHRSTEYRRPEPGTIRPATVAKVDAGARSGANEGAPVPARTNADVKAQAAAAGTLEELKAAVSVCRACSLCKTRTQTVFMDGVGGRGVLFVGEAPGADEDRTGVPFVGRSGQLLTDIIEKGMGIPRSEVHIANVLKCRPPENRDPTPAEKETCTPWLDRQIELIDPKVIIPLGRHAAMHVLGVEATMGALRQKVHSKGERKVVPTFHPSYLLRSPGEKKAAWQDIQLAMEILGLKRGKD